jgi:glyoxylase-like metal-dependent hydrolase (beta-lactamase superfamily II)
MKRMHRSDLFAWSVYSEKLDIDFSGYAWIREGGNVLIDPPPMTPHDLEHLTKLGGAKWIILSNSDHVRGAAELAPKFGAQLVGPAAERETFPLPCQRWLSDGEEVVPGLWAFELDGSKTPGELALVLEETTLICGDLLRSHRAGSLMLLLPEQKLADRGRALASIARLAARLPRLEAILVGDGFSIYREGQKRLAEFLSANPLGD